VEVETLELAQLAIFNGISADTLAVALAQAEAVDLVPLAL
jgi:hypothetical protein